MKQLFISHSVWVLLIVSLLCACSPHPERTIENIKRTVVCQHNASIRYHAFSVQAESEGYRNVSNFFEAISCSEKIHADRLCSILGQYDETVDMVVDSLTVVGLTIDNLNISSQDQRYKAQTLLPSLISVANKEQAVEVRGFLQLMANVSYRHSELFSKILMRLVADTSDRNVVNSWSMCPVCGSSYRTAGLKDKCSLCNKRASFFVLFQK